MRNIITCRPVLQHKMDKMDNKMEHKNLIVEVKDSIGWITMNRPQALNALNTETLDELEHAVETLDNDTSVRILIITGEGKAFVAGADILLICHDHGKIRR